MVLSIFYCKSYTKVYSHLIPTPREGRHKNWPWGTRHGSHYKVLELWLAFFQILPLQQNVQLKILYRYELHSFCFDSWFLSWKNYTTKWKRGNESNWTPLYFHNLLYLLSYLLIHFNNYITFTVQEITFMSEASCI